MKNIFNFIKWSFQDLEAWQYRYIAYMTWVIGFAFVYSDPVISAFGLIAMFIDMFISIVVMNYQRFKREQDQA